MMVTPTPAVLFRLVCEFRPTLLLDETEGLSKEDARDVLAILNCEGEHPGSAHREGADRGIVIEATRAGRSAVELVLLSP
jgi:hypothetical protein